MSALKTWILFFCAVFLLAACSDDSNPQKVEEGADAGSSGSAGSVVNGSAGSVNGETIVKPGDKIVINGGKDTILVADATGSLYYSSGVFCWTEGCEKKYASSSSTSKPTSSATKPSGSSSSTGSQPKSSATKPSSSSQAPAISVDSRAPTVDKANLKLTDIRNNKTYGLLKIGTVYWMTSNLTYKPNTGFYCDATVSVDKPGPGEEKETVGVCDYYGVYYTYDAAKVVCPSGWRLPTKTDLEEALVSMGGDKASSDNDLREELDEWWVLGGRFIYESSLKFGNDGGQERHGQGHLWMQKSGSDVAIRFQDYGTWEVPKYVTESGAAMRAYNVRCVMSE
ncbi:MAG: hypothetical protein IJ896_00820 [Fibrobacter sp.]|nr:hypothetical protein [Fibrobacter sp.]